jgi:hypothetical protein
MKVEQAPSPAAWSANQAALRRYILDLSLAPRQIDYA